jgi:hypothetical protein
MHYQVKPRGAVETKADRKYKETNQKMKGKTYEHEK